MRADAPGADVIDGYLAALAARLRGPRNVRRDLLVEARDGLVDAAERYRECGLPEDEAARRAVVDFGPLPVIARAYQAELGLATGVRTLLSLVVAVPLVHVLWLINRELWIGSWDEVAVPRPPEWYLGFTSFYGLMSWVAAIVAAVALGVGRWMSRRAVDSGRLGRMAGMFATSVVTSYLVAQVAVIAGGFGFSPTWLEMPAPMVLGGVLSVLVTMRLLALSWKSIAWSTV